MYSAQREKTVSVKTAGLKSSIATTLHNVNNNVKRFVCEYNSFKISNGKMIYRAISHALDAQIRWVQKAFSTDNFKYTISFSQLKVIKA